MDRYPADDHDPDAQNTDGKNAGGHDADADRDRAGDGGPAAGKPDDVQKVPGARVPMRRAAQAQPPLEARQVWTPLPPRRGPFAGWWGRPGVVLGIILVQVLLLAATAYVASRAITAARSTSVLPAASPTPSPSPSPSPSSTPGVDPDPDLAAPSVTAPPPTQDGTSAVSERSRSTLPPEVAGVPYQTGVIDLGAFGANLDINETAIFDSGIDLERTSYGLHTANSAVLARVVAGGRPYLRQCEETPIGDWVSDVPTAELEAGDTFCVVTSEDRYGYLIVRGLQVDRDGLGEVTFSFLIWAAEGD